MSVRKWVLALALVGPLAGLSPGLVGAEKLPLREPTSLGTLRAATADSARGQALDWLKGIGKSDAVTMKKFEEIWAQNDFSVLDRVISTLTSVDPAAAKLLEEARDPATPAPVTVPSILTDKKKPAFFRANLTLAYAKSLCNRKVFEETVEALKTIKPDQVVDPGAYFFHRAVAEHGLNLKDDANRSIVGLMEDVSDAPDRYRLLGMLMFAEMLNWRDKDIGTIARLMENSGRRLELSRGGPKTQKIQKTIVARLDEIIKELEKPSDCNGGCCPNGGQPGSSGGANPSSPMKDSNIATNGGPGNVDPKKLRGLAQQWGKLPDKERAKAMQDLIKDMPPRHREIIENYFKKIAQAQNSP